MKEEHDQKSWNRATLFYVEDLYIYVNKTLAIKVYSLLYMYQTMYYFYTVRVKDDNIIPPLKSMGIAKDNYLSYPNNMSKRVDNLKFHQMTLTGSVWKISL